MVHASETTLARNVAFLGILMHLFPSKHYQHVRNAVFDVFVKSVPVQAKRGETGGLLQAEKLS